MCSEIPCAAESYIARLEWAQNIALPLITVQYAATPLEALRKECALISLPTELKRLVAKASKNAVRLPEDHPRRISFSGPVGKRINRDNWSNKG